jgi:hydroxypyruvate reductase 1
LLLLEVTMPRSGWSTHNPLGSRRVVVTKELPGERWLQILADADCRVEVSTSRAILPPETIAAAIGRDCAAVIGQLTESWNDKLLARLKAAGGRVYSNYAVGFNNVDLAAATRLGLPVGNTPGVLTETTAELAVALTLAAARRIAEGDAFMRSGEFARCGWLPTMLLGKLLRGKTLGIVGAGRIGSTYARMMVEGHRMNLIYHDVHRNGDLEASMRAYSAFLEAHGEPTVGCRRVSDLDELLRTADIVSVHTVLDESTHHLFGAKQFATMKPDGIFVNASRGPLHDEAALVRHCRSHPEFAAALDVFEDEPRTAPGLASLPNIVMVPHLGSATRWTRESMATLAAANAAAILQGLPVWNRPDVLSFLSEAPPAAAPSIVNAGDLGLPVLEAQCAAVVVDGACATEKE